MLEQSLLINLSSPGIADSATSRFRQEYQAYQNLFQAQPALVQQYLGIQAASTAEAVVQGSSKIHFSLPDVVTCAPISDGCMEDNRVPADRREHHVGGGLGRLTHPDLRRALCQRLSELERSPNHAESTSANLVRYAIAIHMVYNMLPAGRSVIYKSVDGDDIPNQPVEQDTDLGSAISSSTGAQSTTNLAENGRGELSVPYVEAARRFYLPQWVAFNNHGNLLQSSVGEAEACIASMQQYMAILNSANAVAPFMVADEVWQQKRYGMLGQLVNQGRAMANYQSHEIIKTIQHRAASHNLDRGLSLSLPYFNDQTLKVEDYCFDVIPAGRVMFIPAFVVLAVRVQGVKVAQDTSMSQSTRRHLLMELSALEESFLR
jgi:hypothetical protein